jgi:hypothetical protein
MDPFACDDAAGNNSHKHESKLEKKRDHNSADSGKRIRLQNMSGFGGLADRANNRIQIGHGASKHCESLFKDNG